MMYWLSIYALVIVSVFLVMGFVYLALAVGLWMAKGVQRIRAIASMAVPGELSRERS